MQQKMKLRSRKELFKCVQRADGCLYPIAGTSSASVLAPSPRPLTHAWVISSFLPLLSHAAICGDRSGVWDREWSKNGRKRKHRRRYDTNTIAKTCPWGAGNSYSHPASLARSAPPPPTAVANNCPQIAAAEGGWFGVRPFTCHSANHNCGTHSTPMLPFFVSFEL